MKKTTKGQKVWRWTKIGLGTSAVILTIREAYLAFGPRREMRRAVYEQAYRRAKELGVPLLVLGDPDGGLMNHALGRQWQCGTGTDVICIDPAGCGLCPQQIQGFAEDALSQIPTQHVVVYDPGAFAFANDGAKLAKELARVAIHGEVYIADVEPWSLAAFFEPKRKRRILTLPQVSPDKTLVWKPLWWRTEPSTGLRSEQFAALKGLGQLAQLGRIRNMSGGMTHPPIFQR